jgi:predicted phosphodiesterase
MRTVIVSDTHVGDPRYHNNQHVQDLLKTATYDRLVLNGDFADLWLSGFKHISSDPLFKLVADLSLTKQVVWVRGNHDWDITQYVGSPELKNMQIVNRCQLTEGGKNILVLHGHQVYSTKNRSLWIKLASRLVRFVWRLTGLDFQKIVIGGQNDYIQRDAQGKRQELAYKFPGYDWIVMGHTHIIGSCTGARVKLLDIGSTYQTKSYGLVQDGEVTLKLIGEP